MDLTVVTATHQRHGFLCQCLHQFQQQHLGGLKCEHIVVSDGIDPHAEKIATDHGARFDFLSEALGQAGSFAKDRGIQLARGKYVCFWDDDNIYEPHALTTLFATASGFDIGVVRAVHRLRKKAGFVTIPRRWDDTFRLGDIDTMNVCVRTELAKKELWEDPKGRHATDFHWLNRLSEHNPTLRYVPIVIGKHV